MTKQHRCSSDLKYCEIFITVFILSGLSFSLGALKCQHIHFTSELTYNASHSWENTCFSLVCIVYTELSLISLPALQFHWRWNFVYFNCRTLMNYPETKWNPLGVLRQDCWNFSRCGFQSRKDLILSGQMYVANILDVSFIRDDLTLLKIRLDIGLFRSMTPPPRMIPCTERNLLWSRN